MKFLLFALLGAGFMHATQIQAQDRFPEFSLGGTLSDIQNIEDDEPVDYSIQTPLMNDILNLQEQISLLEALVERQGEISRIAASYENVGLEFRQPAPAVEACEKLPVNLLCLYSYPDMEKNVPVVEDQKERLIAQQQKAMEEAIASFLENNQPMTASASQEFADLGIDDISDSIPMVEKTVKQLYYWSDIQCLLGQCSALIVSASDETERYRVKKGDSFGDNIDVKDININGIEVAVHDESYFLNPKPLTPDAGRFMQFGDMPAMPPAPEPSILRDLDLQNNQAQVAMPENAINNEESVMAPEPAPEGDLLGPTGLF